MSCPELAARGAVFTARTFVSVILSPPPLDALSSGFVCNFASDSGILLDGFAESVKQSIALVVCGKLVISSKLDQEKRRV